MHQFNTELPSTRHIQNLIENKVEVEVKISTGDSLLGKITWQDSNCLSLISIGQHTTLVYYSGIIYIQTHS